MAEEFQLEELISHIVFVGKGVGLTLQLLVGAITIGTFLGLVFAVLRHNNIAVFLINRIISILRGTPLILQLSFIYFAIPSIITEMRMSIATAGMIAFGTNSSAYIAEIFRAGIQNLPKGQFEAAKTLKIPTFYMWKDIILPQVIRNIFPAMLNEFIALLKDTAIISVIGGVDIMRSAEMLAARQYTYFMPLCIAACYYYGLVVLIEYIGKKFEEKVFKC